MSLSSRYIAAKPFTCMKNFLQRVEESVLASVLESQPLLQHGSTVADCVNVYVFVFLGCISVSQFPTQMLFVLLLLSLFLITKGQLTLVKQI